MDKASWWAADLGWLAVHMKLQQSCCSWFELEELDNCRRVPTEIRDWMKGIERA